MQLRTETWQVITEQDFSEFVSEVYGRPYCLQQQEPLMSNGEVRLVSFPIDWTFEGEKEKFEEWRDFDITQPIENPRWIEYEKSMAEKYGAELYKQFMEQDSHQWKLYWHREFYPPLSALVDDLLERGLVESGDYAIHSYW